MSQITSKIYFGPFSVNSQVFHSTQYSFALVNLKPLLPGHVLVSPRRVTPRLSDLTPIEVSDLFLTVQRVGSMLERYYNATSLNIAIQDGADAGQSVPHVHAHLLPRKRADLHNRGGSDAIYSMIEGEDGNIGKNLWDRERPRFPAVNEETRRSRSDEELADEARVFAQEMEKQ